MLKIAAVVITIHNFLKEICSEKISFHVQGELRCDGLVQMISTVNGRAIFIHAGNNHAADHDLSHSRVPLKQAAQQRGRTFDRMQLLRCSSYASSLSK